MNYDYGQSPEWPTSILNLTILDASTLTPEGKVNADTRIQVGVRSTEVNTTHPHVISTPTQRIPDVLFNAILESSQGGAAYGKELELSFPEQFLSIQTFESDSLFDNEQYSGHEPVIYAVNSLLTQKFGAGSALERGQIRYRATPASLIVGAVLYDNLDNLSDALQPKRDGIVSRSIQVDSEEGSLFKEYHRMCSILVLLEGAEHIPDSTPSYSEIRWISVAEYQQMSRSR
ncbi:MAG: hypothetical protein ACXWAA_11760, partial [Methylobacter sp.]